MATIMEVEHILSRGTVEAFDTYEKAYGDFSIPVMRDVGMNIIGAWRQVMGPIGRDLLVVDFDSLGHLEEVGAKLAGRFGELEGTLTACEAAGIGIEEVTDFGITLPFVDAEVAAAGAPAAGGTPRQYCLVRREIARANAEKAVGALAGLAAAQASSGSAKLFTAYSSMTTRNLTEIWVFDQPGLDPYAGAPTALVAPLDDVTTSASTLILEPLSYSAAR